MKRDLSDEAVTAALVRAGRAARRLAEELGTPFWVVVEGRLVDLNAKRRGRRRRS